MRNGPFSKVSMQSIRILSLGRELDCGNHLQRGAYKIPYLEGSRVVRSDCNNDNLDGFR